MQGAGLRGRGHSEEWRTLSRAAVVRRAFVRWSGSGAPGVPAPGPERLAGPVASVFVPEEEAHETSREGSAGRSGWRIDRTRCVRRCDGRMKRFAEPA